MSWKLAAQEAVDTFRSHVNDHVWKVDYCPCSGQYTATEKLNQVTAFGRTPLEAKCRALKAWVERRTNI